MRKRPQLTKRQLSRRRNLRETAPETEPVSPEETLLDYLFASGHIGYREALVAYARGYSVATLDRIAKESAAGGIRALPNVVPNDTQAERGSAPKPALVRQRRASEGSSTPYEAPRFTGRLVAVFSETGPRCALCGRGIKSRGGVELRNAGQWWPVCREDKGRVAVARKAAA